MFYASPDYSHYQMEQIRLGLKHGLAEDQVRLFAEPGFNEHQMYQIRLGLEHGLTKEQAGIYAVPEFDAWQMEEIRGGLEQGIALREAEKMAEAVRKHGADWKTLREMKDSFISMDGNDLDAAMRGAKAVSEISNAYRKISKVQKSN